MYLFWTSIWEFRSVNIYNVIVCAQTMRLIRIGWMLADETNAYACRYASACVRFCGCLRMHLFVRAYSTCVCRENRARHTPVTSHTVYIDGRTKYTVCLIPTSRIFWGENHQRMFDEREWVAATIHACFLKKNCALAVTVQLTRFAKRQSTRAFVTNFVISTIANRCWSYTRCIRWHNRHACTHITNR